MRRIAVAALVVSSIGFAASARGAAPTAAAAAAAAPPEGRPVTIATSYTLPSAVLGETRRVNVYLPAGYAEGDRRYPVLYLLDGGEGEDFHHISGLVQIGTMNGTMREVILVGLENTDRKRDFTWPSTDPRDRAEVPTHGGAAKFREFVGRELKPWVEAHFRTDGDDGVIGESLAGLFIVETLLRSPELFDRWVAISPSLWWDRGSLGAAAPELLRAASFAGDRLWLSVADEGGAMGVDAFAEALRAGAPAGLEWTFEPLRNETHGTIYHPAALLAMRALWAPPPAPVPTEAPAN